MKVSVVIPTHSRSDYLIRAIESVLNQTYLNVEIIVVDDNGKGSQQNETKRIINKYKEIQLITYDKNQGACYARNIGVKNASGEIIMFLDDDDFYLESKITEQIKVFSEANIDACICSMQRVDENNNEIISKENYPRGNDLKSCILDGNCFTTMIAIKKNVFESLGGFSEIPRYQDKFFMYKFHKNSLKLKLLHKQLFVMVEHKGNRISLGNVSKISKALGALFQFEKENFHLFNRKEKKLVINRYYKNMAEIRTNGAFDVRLRGLFYLMRSNLFSISNNFSMQKILIRLILSDKVYTKL